MKIAGIHAVKSVIENDPTAAKILYVREKPNSRLAALYDIAKQKGVACQYVKAELLDTLTTENHQGAVLELRNAPAYTDPLSTLDGRPILVLDQITDARNLGACLRAADAFGIKAVIVPKDNSAQLNTAASKVASGAASSVPVIAVTNLKRTLEDLKKQGYWIVGAALEGKSILQTTLPTPSVICLGAEGKGLRAGTIAACDVLVKIPMLGSVQSLNVATATGVVLYELMRQNPKNLT